MAKTAITLMSSILKELIAADGYVEMEKLKDYNEDGFDDAIFTLSRTKLIDEDGVRAASTQAADRAATLYLM